MNILGANALGSGPLGGELFVDDADHKMPFHWGEAFTPVDSIIPIEWGQHLELDHLIPVDWTIEIFIEAYGEMPIEAVNQFEMDPQVIRFEHAGTILANPGNIPFEYRHIVDPSDHQIPTSWQEYFSINRVIPIEHLNEIDTDPQQIIMEWKNQVTPFDRIINLEYLNQIEISDHLMPVAYNEGLELDYLMPVEHLHAIQQDNAIPYEHRRAILVGGNHTILVEWGAAITQDHQIPFHWFEGRELDHAIPVQIIGTIIHDGNMPVDWLAAITQDHQIPFHWFEGRELDHTFPLAINQQHLLDRILLIDSDGVLLPTYNTNVGKIFSIKEREFFWSMKKQSDQHWSVKTREFTWNVKRKDKY